VRRARRCVDILDACETLKRLHPATFSADERNAAYKDGGLYHLLDRIRAEALEMLLRGLDLADLEYHYACGEFVDTIQGVSDPKGDSWLSPWVHMERCGGVELGGFCDALCYGCYFSLPGSKSYGLAAIVEAARARLGEARQ
jgi:hypothetical protein